MPEPESQLIRARLDSLARFRARGVDPYPHRVERTHTTAEAVGCLESLEREGAGAGSGECVSVAGRIMQVRGMGRATFLDIQDGHGRIQALLRRNVLQESYEGIRDLDIGDWLGVTGPLMRTRTGEPTVEVRQWKLLSKSLRPLPEKWHGLVDVEARYRRRYLDLISNEEARRIATLRSRVVSALRRMMDARGFMEVETPMLVSVPAGGTATPFSTHYRALNRDLFLRIATELFLKKLVIGGLEKVYEIGRIFRNEGVDLTHNPEFTTMESYEAFADYNDVMRMVEELVHGIAVEVTGSATVTVEGECIDLTPPWPRRTLRDEVRDRSGIDFLECPDIESLSTEMKRIGLDVGHQVSWGGLLDKLLSDTVEPHLVQPTFLVDYPVEMSPLAKKRPDDERLVERFEGFAAGMEICNAFTELNDPVDQRERMERQEALNLQYRDEDMDRLDEDFLLALEHGMPPTGGLGVGIDRLIMLFTGQQSIREVVLFPQLRDG